MLPAGTSTTFQYNKMALLPSLLSHSAPSLLQVAIPCCVSAFCGPNRFRHLATAPATALAAAIQSPTLVVQQQSSVAQHTPTLEQLQAAAVAAAAKHVVKKRIARQIPERIQTASLGITGLVARLGARRRGKVMEQPVLALSTFASVEIIEGQRTVAPQDIARGTLRAIGEAAAVDGQEDAWKYNPRYLGNYPELVLLFSQPGWTMNKLRRTLEEPRYLAQLGLTKDEFKLYDLDHIIPKSQGGPDHPCNLVVMPHLHNQQYGNRLPVAKVQEVGYRVMLQATCFYLFVHKLDDNLLGPLKLAAARIRASCNGGIECRFLKTLSL